MTRALLLLLIRAYRRVVSPFYGQVCKYHPSCSAYALDAVETHGAARGSLLAGWRVLRCNPFSHGGYDPVPPAGRWRTPADPGASADPAGPVPGDAGRLGSHGRGAMSDDGASEPSDARLVTAGLGGSDPVPPTPGAVTATAAAGDARP